MGIDLIGTAGSRRTEYFQKAADECGTALNVIDWSEVADADLSGDVVKIDPPSYLTSNLLDMNEQVLEYRARLKKLEQGACTFLNTPAGILSVLDKSHCKRVLQENGIAVTQMIAETVYTVEELQSVMDGSRVFSVFLKPVWSSGAAGVVAYRKYPGTEKEVAYTSCCVRGEELVNTKTIYRLEGKEEIRQLLRAVLSLGAIVERWHPKASYRGKSYDLRVVWQFGAISFIVARQSSGPITNLHLNNSPLSWRELGLSDSLLAETSQLCGEAMKLFSGLSMAGIDILLEKGGKQPRIIEINGQGDLIYQDIFHENTIYKRQIEELRRL